MELYQDIPRSYTALAECLATLLVCFALPRKVSAVRLSIYAVLFLVIQTVFLVSTKSVPGFLWLPVMLVAFSFMGGFLFLVCDAGKRVLAYFTLSAVILAEFAASFEWQMANYVLTIHSGILLQILVLVASYAFVFYIAYHLEAQSRVSMSYFEISVNELLGIAALTAAIFAVSNISFISRRTPFSGAISPDIFYIRTLVDFVGVALLHAYRIRICEMNARKELSSIQAMLREQYDKYRSYQSGFEMINIKYHDLKHQLVGLRGEMSEAKRLEWIKTLEEELEEYRPEMQTKNSVLDTIIAGKMMDCRSQNIKLTCVADGTLLENMHVTDICTIFGNALDNAIEAVSFVRDEEKRLIHLTVTEQKNFLLIEVSNYYEGEVKISKGRIKTTKNDVANHGFGIKSIRYAVEKYKGFVRCETKDNWFDLKILIPQKKQV